MLEIRFSNETSGQNIDAATSLLLQPRLWTPSGDYPAHPEWVDMAIAEIEGGRKRAMVARMDSEPVGVLVYQRHKSLPHQIEIKNLSVAQRARGRRIADFLFRQVEVEAPHEFPGTSELIGDTKITNQSMLAFAAHNGMTATLYPSLDSHFDTNGIIDVLLSKRLPSPDRYWDVG